MTRADAGSRLMKGLETSRVDLVVACPMTVGVFWVAPFVAATGAPVSDIRDFPPAHVYAQLDTLGVDLAVGTMKPPEGLAMRMVGRPRLTVQYPASSPWALSEPGLKRLEGVELAALKGLPLLVPARGSATRHELDAVAAAHEIPLTYVREVASGTVAQSLAAAGRGLAVAAEAPQFGLQASYLQADGVDLAISDWAAWDPHHYAAPEIEQVVIQMEEWVRGRFGVLSDPDLGRI
ncbi:LysR family transcriptional regulator substrate-binding protein [Pseudarthrobacter sp. J75]|uniref:LysR family transcriptional regulator substrate-binding protein n=1 Tax=unclassified Pseudarthrobacter TaxID=2647000 RepID=UPI002E81EEC1|nr:MULTISPECIES: LysR family transcriptional regulator substrate-binding protein [unclassified Pseudarthrobacter]MEE2522806.1 LysR family transcriptional regulator substrate-binding protein [Pseudarthrobacter sp. J47]MEE2529667.1 LysR family transcriptional regulator substrate-binding protein [Pseudarthrobacter sp. J75]